MKIKVALIFTGLLLSFGAMAQQNQQGYKVTCSSGSYSADTVEGAVDMCNRYASRSRSNCNRGVSCRTYLTHCTAKGYAGSNVADAISACRQFTSFDVRSCARSVSCR